MTEGEEDDILIERRGAIVIVTLNRPARRNGVTIPMCQRLHDFLRAIAASDARVVILRGAGDHFCVGADLQGPTLERGGRSLIETFGTAFDVATVLHHMPQVTIAAIDGACAGGGIAWAAACDFRFASPRAIFSTAYLRIGVPGDMGLIWTLERIVGGARAREMLFFPDKFGTEQALVWGFVTRVHETEMLFEAALTAAGELAARPAFSLRVMKANILSAETLPMEAYVQLETARMAEVSTSGAIRDGIADFMSKTP